MLHIIVDSCRSILVRAKSGARVAMCRRGRVRSKSANNIPVDDAVATAVLDAEGVDDAYGADDRS